MSIKLGRPWLTTVETMKLIVSERIKSQKHFCKFQLDLFRFPRFRRAIFDKVKDTIQYISQGYLLHHIDIFACRASYISNYLQRIQNNVDDILYKFKFNYDYCLDNTVINKTKYQFEASYYRDWRHRHGQSSGTIHLLLLAIGT